MRARRRLAIVAVALAAALSLLVGLVVVIGGIGSALDSTERESSVVREPIERLVVEVGSGDVTVVAGAPRRTVRISRTSTSFLVGPKVTQRVRGAVLRLSGDCPLPLPGPCQTNYRLEVPRDVGVTADSTAGNVRVEAVGGPVVARSTAGSITAWTTVGNAAVRAR